MRRDRPSIPGYGAPESDDDLLDWDWTRRRLELGLTYWLSTTRFG